MAEYTILQIIDIIRGLRPLERAGIDLPDLSEQLRNSPALVQRVVDAINYEEPKPEMGTVPAELDFDAYAAFLNVALNQSPLYGRDEERAEWYERFNSREGIQILAGHIRARDWDWLVTYYGLSDGIKKSYADVARMAGLTYNFVRTHIVESTRQTAYIIWNAYLQSEDAKLREEQVRIQAIALLGLTERVERMLEWAHINTIPKLVAHSEADLRRITNLSVRGIEEIKARLAERGVELMQ